MINSINHIGIGAVNAQKTFDFFKNYVGFKTKMNDFEKEIPELSLLINEVPTMKVLNCGCPYGGGFAEIFQYVSREPIKLEGEYTWSRTGYLGAGIEVFGLDSIYDELKSKIPVLTKIEQLTLNNSTVWDSFCIKSPEGFTLHLIDKKSEKKIKKPFFSGIHHVIIGVNELEKEVYFYKEIMGFDKIVFQGVVKKERLGAIMPNAYDAEMVILERSLGSTSIMSSYTGGMIILIDVKNTQKKCIYQNRFFGDPGISELGFDVSDIHGTYNNLIKLGAKPLVPPIEFNWFPGPKGALAYLADYEENILELIETEKVFGVDISIVDKMCIRPIRYLIKKGFFL